MIEHRQDRVILLLLIVDNNITSNSHIHINDHINNF